MGLVWVLGTLLVWDLDWGVAEDVDGYFCCNRETVGSRFLRMLRARLQGARLSRDLTAGGGETPGQCRSEFSPPSKSCG